VYVVVAVSPEVAPVAVIVFAPLFCSATVVRAPQLGLVPKELSEAPVVHVNEVVVNIGVETVTDSPEPKPVTTMDGVTPSSGKPKLAAAKVTVTADLTVNDAVPVLTLSETEMVCAPPGRFGTLTSTAKLPTAVVVRHPRTTRLSTAGVALLAPPLAVAQAPFVNHGTVVVPTSVVMVIGDAGRNPLPVTTMVDPTVPDVVAVRTPLDIVDRVTVGVAACTGEAGSRNTIPAIPARNSSPIVPKEASLLFGVICICILFTYFRNSQLPNYRI